LPRDSWLAFGNLISVIEKSVEDLADFNWWNSSLTKPFHWIPVWSKTPKSSFIVGTALCFKDGGEKVKEGS